MKLRKPIDKINVGQCNIKCNITIILYDKDRENEFIALKHYL